MGMSFVIVGDSWFVGVADGSELHSAAARLAMAASTNAAVVHSLQRALYCSSPTFSIQFDVPALHSARHGQVAHRGGGRRPVPMLHARRAPDGVARDGFPGSVCPSSCVSPTPDITTSLWPAGCVCQAERAPGSKVTMPARGIDMRRWQARPDPRGHATGKEVGGPGRRRLGARAADLLRGGDLRFGAAGLERCGAQRGAIQG
jgi:hypothetical protein